MDVSTWGSGAGGAVVRNEGTSSIGVAFVEAWWSCAVAEAAMRTVRTGVVWGVVVARSLSLWV